MELRIKKPPYLRDATAKSQSSTTMLAALLALYAMAVFYYGPRVLLLLATGVVTAAAADAVCVRLRTKGRVKLDASSLVTGLLIPLLLPASVDYQLVVTGVVFAIVIGKYAFGGFGNNIFNPAATAMCFLTVCYPQRVFLYPTPQQWLPLANVTLDKYADAPGALLKYGGVPQHNMGEMLLGNFAGPMGATAILVILACMVFLRLRKTIRVAAPVGVFVAVTLLSLLFPRVQTDTVWQMLAFELMSGSVLFASAFMLTDPVTSPHSMTARFIYGLLCGAMTVFMTRAGAYQEGIWFAIVIINFFSLIIDEAVVRAKLAILVTFLKLRRRLGAPGGESA